MRAELVKNNINYYQTPNRALLYSPARPTQPSASVSSLTLNNAPKPSYGAV